ncbi:binding-protein-dependent transport system innermembrane protein [Leptotrichia shahii]|uniref:Binding-protein-dependent transport system innermembrane protein n=1 Tax=Leptotrichia shahii TaxID=157691 RepID=A0A510JPD2_9FUSO|nr:ABC transporter permease [Leptotrichia shahii]BBM41230.1 binding-protein-dependent transport system innermembrane protein [Leptotrichia shahii]
MSNNEVLKENNEKTENFEIIKKSGNKPTGISVIAREILKDKLALASLIILVILFGIIFIGSLFANQEEIMKISLLDKYAIPMKEGFWLGSDSGGRSILGQLILGARNSIIIGFAITILTSGIGIFLGLIAGYYGKWVDNVIMRIIDFITILPTLMIIIVFVTIVPKYTITTFVLIMSTFYWVGSARLIRSKALSESKKDYVLASKTMGTKDLTIIFREILPNLSSIIIVELTLAFAGNIGIETGLSFLGFGLPLSTPSLGTLVGYAADPEVLSTKLWIWLPASILILIVMLCINYVGQALNRAADAKQRRG